LYDRLLLLHVDVPSFRSLSIRLMRTHLLTLLLDSDHDNHSHTHMRGSRGNSVEQFRRESLDILSVDSPRHLLFLNLDACVDSCGQTQEALSDLLTALASMVKTSCAALTVLQAKQVQVVEAEEQAALAAAAAAQRNGLEEEEEDEEGVVTMQQSQVQCTQYGYFSQVDALPPTTTSSSQPFPPPNTDPGRSRSSSRAQRRLDEFAQEVDDAFAVLWRLGCGLARGKPQDFGLPLQPSTRWDGVMRGGSALCCCLVVVCIN
jgi:hypothetical protein